MQIIIMVKLINQIMIKIIKKSFNNKKIINNDKIKIKLKMKIIKKIKKLKII